MKRQYLGDAKDAFKWDYLDFLTRGLKIQLLNILLMLTPDDNSKQGKSNPRLFPAPDIWPFCDKLREKRDFGLLRGLPERVALAGRATPPYEVRLHNGESLFVNSGKKRVEYFSGLPQNKAQIVFLDPDVGFEPQGGGSEEHVKFSDVRKILGEISQDSVVVIYQDLTRKIPQEFFSEIQGKFSPEQITAVYWGGRAMFFALGKPERINKVRDINRAYQKLPGPVQTPD